MTDLVDPKVLAKLIPPRVFARFASIDETKTPFEAVDALHAVAEALENAQKLDLALLYYEAAVGKLNKLPTQDFDAASLIRYAENLAAYTNNYGLCFKKADKFKEAEQQYLKALEVFTEYFGSTDSRMGITLESLATLYMEMGRKPDAKKTMKRRGKLSKEPGTEGRVAKQMRQELMGLKDGKNSKSAAQSSTRDILAVGQEVQALLDMMGQRKARNDGNCNYCGKPELNPGDFKKCAACKTVGYCNKECQVADWKGGHKQACKEAINNAKHDLAAKLNENPAETLKLSTLLQTNDLTTNTAETKQAKKSAKKSGSKNAKSDKNTGSTKANADVITVATS